MTEIPSSTPAINPTDHLPLTLLTSDTIPPAPTGTRSTVDWLPDFGGYAWAAYGASSLLVISHLPSPLSADETFIGPILRQVFELSGDTSSPVSSVSWSPVTPSAGELAAGSGNCICVFSADSAASKGSFCWSQNAVLVQTTKVEAIEWTGSGDGIVSGGFDVILWKRKNRSWEIAWKFKGHQPQNLVSATWSIEGPSATATFPGKLCTKGPNDASNSVLVCYGNGLFEFARVELRHPQPVSMIQWRPSIGRQSWKDSRNLCRHMLLTCCLDGTVRLWTEVDNGKVRKLGKENNEQKPIRRSFCVAAVIEINQSLNGTLGVDVFLTWATEISGLYRTEGANQFFSTEGYGPKRVGACEWLIGFGPGTWITFWAIHCLDDTSSMRFPRVTLWKRQELKELEVGHLHRAGFSNLKNWLFLNKVVISRNCLSGPPNICSLIHLLPCNSLVWSVLCAQTCSNTEDTSFNNSKIDSYLSCSAGGVLNAGHTGKILQVAIHPHIYGVELAVSLDSNGLVLFWLVSAISNCNLNLPTHIPSWKLCGKLVDHDSPSKYTSLRWAPSVFGEDRILLMGHAGGIDCFMVEISQSQEEDLRCHYICTIPPTGRGPYEDGPTNIYAIPLLSTCDKTFQYNKFLLLGIWMRGFCALSWEVILHSYDSSGSCCDCNFDDNNEPLCCELKFENSFSNKRYCIGVNPCSSEFPELHSADDITSFSVVCPSKLMPMQECLGFDKDLCNGVPAYVMATGYTDGKVKLWRSNSSKHSTQIPWELVGKFVAHQGPVHAICLSTCGQKIATISIGSHLESIGILHIWETVNLIGAGSFLLEDQLSVGTDVVALNWLDLGNGQLFLGVCLQNELQVYAQKHTESQVLFNCENVLNLQTWSCIAVAPTFPAIRDFVWGPRVMPVIVHDSYISLLGDHLFFVDNKQKVKCSPNFIQDSCVGGKENDMSSSVFMDRDIDIGNINKQLAENSRREHWHAPPVKIDEKNDWLSSSLFVALAQIKHGSSGMLGSWSLVEIAEKLKETLPVYHPKALLMNVFSGNWKRAHLSVRHLVEYLTCASERIYRSVKCDHIIPQISLSSYFEGLLLKDSSDKGFQWITDARSLTSSSWSFAYDTKSDTFSAMSSPSSSKSELSGYVEPIEKLYELASLTNTEKLQILAIIDLLGEVQHSASAYESLDEPGRRFWIALRFQQLNFFRSFGRLPSVEELVVDGRLMCWAFHSDCQESLLTSFLPKEPSWKEMRNLGVGFWLTNVAQLRTRMERLARLQYLRNKDPKDCALLYIALNRIQVLVGLFKISKDEKDKPLVGFLLRNFQEEKNKAAALKNAYVLMGRHQLELAVAFFLLGGDTQSAVNVCAKNLKDEQLALVICRIVEGRCGPLECQLITKFVLPSASERGDYWLTSLLEWELGNYSKSFLSMLGPQASPLIDKSTVSLKHVALIDPHAGLYCLSLSTNNSMKNAIGEQNAAILGRWATFVATTAFKRCGLPLEALECLSSSSSTIGISDQGNVSVDDLNQLPWEVLKPSSSGSFPWLLSDVAFRLESQIKLDLALCYFSKLAREHPHWPGTILGPFQAGTHIKDSKIQLEENLRTDFQEKLYAGLSMIEQKFLVISSCIIKMIIAWLWNIRLSFIGYDLLLDYTSQDHLVNKSHTVSNFNLYPLLHKPLMNSIENISFLLSRFMTSSSITFFTPKSAEVKSTRSEAQRYYLQSILSPLWSLRASIRVFCGSSKDLTTRPLLIIDLFEYFIHFASAWFLQNPKFLLLMMQPLLTTYTNQQTPYEVNMVNAKNVVNHIEEMLASNLLMDDASTVHKVIKCMPHKQDEEIMQLFSEEEKRHVLGACLWQQMSSFMKQKLHSLSIKLEDNCFSSVSSSKVSFWASGSNNLESFSGSLTDYIESFSLILANLLKTTLVHISSYHVKLLGSFLQLKVENRLLVPSLVWLQQSCLSQAKSPYQEVSVEILNNENESLTFDILWSTCADPNIISEGFEQERINWLRFFSHKSSKVWTDVFKDISEGYETEDASNHEIRVSGSPSSDEAGSPAKNLFRNGRTFLSSWQKDATIIEGVSYFQHAKEIYKRDGELLEALCINSVNERQAALASNRKGIIFFRWEDAMPFRDQSDYIWSDADWPLNGWAGAESTPVPTCVSPGVGLGSKKGALLGLGGATIGMGSFARPRRDLTGGGAFGIPGYAGIGASGLGWEVQEDFEEFVDPPATVENISTRAFSSHPSRPLFLVGSSNTHVYLWEFGKDKAVATYGVLPAANVPPPYALASISALQFDHFGHRFATAALDGTVCSWQLEVGGRSNIRPTESSLCFNGHASDVSYISSSGSIIAAAGSSSNNVNVVIWDTLAPSTTSRASSICHEGGARSISVFDNDIGSGSISPLIITGGKSGDVGLHDFRYIATGRAKRHRHVENGDASNTSSNADAQTGVSNKLGDQNLNGLLWYIPKAHLGSVTKISTIPHTSLFLTGSKDGDVKLWDAKTTKMVYHWPKLHDRRTFLQPSTRGFGGVVRAGVTDIQVVSHGFLTCGGDGSVKFVQCKDYQHLT